MGHPVVIHLHAVPMLLAALLLLGSCGEDKRPRTSMGPWPDGPVTRGSFDPGAAVGGLGGSSTTPPTPPPPAADAGPTADRAGVPDRGTGDCSGVLCFEGQFCLLQAADPAAPGACLPIPSGCTSCDCLKPFVDCVCSSGSGLMLVTCP